MHEHARAVGSASACISSASTPYSSDVLRRDRLVGQLAGLARGHEAGAELERQRGAEDEAARLGGDDAVDARAAAPTRPAAPPRGAARAGRAAAA